MIRKILQDVVPPNKKSIRHIPIPMARRTSVVEVTESEPPARRKRVRKLGNCMRFWPIAVALMLLAGVIVGASMLFESATVTVFPKKATATVDANLQTEMNTKVLLPYTVVTATSTASDLIPTSKEEEVQRKASGEIVVYNNFSSETQRLIKNTRFESSNGRIYKIATSIDVPGQKVEGGKKVPGSINVTVYADVAGPESNLRIEDLKGDFTLPGLKGKPSYELIYARQKTDIAGGFSGKARVVDDKTLEAAINTLKARLGEEIWYSLNSSLPKGYITFRTLYDTEFAVSSKDNAAQGGISVTVVAVGRGLAVEKLSLSMLLAERFVPDYELEPILIQNIGDMSVLPSGKDSIPVWQRKAPSLDVKGNVIFVWQFDENMLKIDLSGRPEKDTPSIMKKYTAISRAESVIRPMWISKYPKNLNKINIKLKLD